MRWSSRTPPKPNFAPRLGPGGRRWWFGWAPALFSALLGVGCASSAGEAIYPHESILTVIAEFKLNGWERDPYRLPPGQDLQGHNIFRVSLERFETLEEIASPEYADVLAFARGQCLERLGQWGAAAEAFESAAGGDNPLAEQAPRRARAARRMARLVGRSAFNHDSLETYLNDLQVMDRGLRAWAEEETLWPYAEYALIEAERGQEEHVRLLADFRRMPGFGVARAIEAAEKMTTDFRESCRATEHWLLLGSLYETLARDWSAQFPPQGVAFETEGNWSGWVEQARVAYRRVARTDGDPAKLEGQARLRALDAYALRMQALAR